MSNTTISAPGQDPDKNHERSIVQNGSLPSADHVKQRLIAAQAEPEHISTVLWLLEYGRSNKHTLSSLARDIGRDNSSISRVLNGKYNLVDGVTKLTEFVEHVDHFRRIQTERMTFGKTPLVETQVIKDVASLCDLARVSATMAFLFGPNQSGKTTALKRYTELNNHGRTIYVRMPVGGSARMFMLALMRACGISERNAYDQMRDRAHRFFDPQTLLIVDEVHQTMNGRSLKTVSIELIREIHDLCGCGVVLCGTDVLPDMMADPRFKKFLGQIDNRGVLRRRIPSKPSSADVRAICNAYGFPPADGDEKDLVKRIAAESGIGRLTKYLIFARQLANNRKAALSWEHFLQSHATFEKWAKGEE